MLTFDSPYAGHLPRNHLPLCNYNYSNNSSSRSNNSCRCEQGTKLRARSNDNGTNRSERVLLVRFCSFEWNFVLVIRWRTIWQDTRGAESPPDQAQSTPSASVFIFEIELFFIWFGKVTKISKEDINQRTSSSRRSCAEIVVPVQFSLARRKSRTKYCRKLKRPTKISWSGPRRSMFVSKSEFLYMEILIK